MKEIIAWPNKKMNAISGIGGRLDDQENGKTYIWKVYKIRLTQRQEEAVARKQIFVNIMTAREGDQKLFFKLLNS